MSILEDPSKHPLVAERAESARNTYQMLEMAIGEPSDREQVVKQLYHDLESEGLVRKAFIGMGTRNFAFDPMLTDMGAAFLKFVSEPT